MCHYQSIRHAHCGHDRTNRLAACAIGHHHSSRCHQRFDMGMRQELSLCPNCRRRVAQMDRHGEDDPLACLSVEIRRVQPGHVRTGSLESVGSCSSE
jgi:hypothetical protein